MHPFATAARMLVELESARLPDLSGVPVLLPHHHAAAPFLDALRREIAAPVFLPPRLLTLPALAAESPATPGAQSQSVRLATLHTLLGGFDWVAEAARWPMAFELLDLIDEMDATLLAPPEAFADFESQLRALSRRLRSTPLSREAELVFQVWRAFHQGPPGPQRDYAQRLALWAEARETPLYTLGLRGLSRLEERFLRRYAASGPVRELPVDPALAQRVALLHQVWSDDAAFTTLRERAEACARELPVSPLAGQVCMHGAAHLEAEADYAAQRIRGWLNAGRRRIGVVALDRLAARRLRAVLERDAILMQDETGWTFSTTVVSHVLDRFFALLEDDFYFRDLLDLLKSPYLFSAAAAPHSELPEFERALHRAGVTRGLSGFLRLARQAGLDHIAGQLQRLGAAAEIMAIARPRRLCDWLQALLAALATLEVVPAWEADSAGTQLLSLLRRLGHELNGDASRHGFAAWRAWLDRQLDRAMFQERDIDSPIRLTHLNAARLRDFEALLVLGADAAHLPPAPHAGPLSDAVRLELGLPGQRQARLLARSALIDVLGQVDSVDFTWQCHRDGNPNTPSPWLDLLDVFHRLSYGSSLQVAAAEPAQTSSPNSAPTPLARPAPALEALPTRLSASGWQSLIDCPYRYFARYGLRLGEADEAAEAMDKRRYGDLLHRVLARFHTARPVLGSTARAALRSELAEVSDSVFTEAGVGDYLLRAWRLRWEKQLDAYLDWALTREADGLYWQEAESSFERPVNLADGRSVTLHGRLDRLDAAPEGSSVVDYKAQTLSTLRAKLKLPGEDIQLAFYGLLSGATRAELVSLDDQRVQAVELADLDEAVAAEADRLSNTLEALASGAGLPATGADSTCQWCEMCGLCRKGHWAAD